VRGWLIGLLSIAACYSPALPLGAPCSPTSECPVEQRCVAGRCALPGAGDADAALPGDAAPPGDAISALDHDGDGIPDVSDNCPEVAVADNAPLDSDGDGVADACDPHPQTPGDRIELFEGFHHGLPGWARTPNWTVVGDAVRGVAAANTSEYLVAPITDPDHITLSASVVVESEVAGTDIHDVDVAAPNNVAIDNGIDCELFQPAQASGRNITLWDDFPNGGNGNQLGSASLPWADGTPYTIALTHSGQSYTCTIDPAGAKHVATGSSGSSAGTQPTAIVRAYAVTARVNWVMVVRSP
jgi:hypothetical protein